MDVIFSWVFYVDVLAIVDLTFECVIPRGSYMSSWILHVNVSVLVDLTCGCVRDLTCGYVTSRGSYIRCVISCDLTC